MVMINSGVYEFNSIQNLIDFIRPLIIEGYPVAANTTFKNYPWEHDIEKFTVYVGEKGVKFYCAEPTQEAAPDESEG